MKVIIYCIISFMLGAACAGAIAVKFSFEMVNDSVLAKISDNVGFYHEIEAGHPEKVQQTIAMSLDWFMKMAQDGQDSFWVDNTPKADQVIADGHKLQQLIAAKKAHQQTTSAPTAQ